MKTLLDIHGEEQAEAIWSNFDREMRQIEANHIKAVKRIDRFYKSLSILVVVIALSPIIALTVRILIRK